MRAWANPNFVSVVRPFSRFSKVVRLLDHLCSFNVFNRQVVFVIFSRASIVYSVQARDCFRVCETLKENERVLKRNISIIKKKIEAFLDANKMYHAETSTHHITRTLYDQQTLYNKEEFTRRYGDKWVTKHCKNSSRSRLTVKEKKEV